MKRKASNHADAPSAQKQKENDVDPSDVYCRTLGGGDKLKQSVLFRPSSTVGVVTEKIPFAHAKMGDTNFITVSVGRGYSVYDANTLRKAYEGPPMNAPIRALLAVGAVTATAVKNEIICWHKGEEVCRFVGHTQKISLMASLGHSYFVSASDRNECFVWKTPRMKDNVHITLEPLAPHGRLAVERVSAMTNVPTYMNKMLVATMDGKLQLWNIKTMSLVHTYDSIGAGVAITSIEAAPNALDMVAVGFQNGRIAFLNAKTDKVLFEFKQSEGAVTAMSFRSEPKAPSTLVTGSPSGTIAAWDLDKKRNIAVVDAHLGSVLKLEFMPGDARVVSSGEDNSLKMWVFDLPDGSMRNLKERVGSAGPIRKFEFYNEKGLDIITASEHRGSGMLGNVAIYQAQISKLWSQKCLQKGAKDKSTQGTHWPSMNRYKHLPPIVDMAFSSMRHYDWAATITCHEGLPWVFVWSAVARALVPKVLAVGMPKVGAVGMVCPISVSVSNCGHYCAVGYDNGTIEKFNLQSGMHRGAFKVGSENAHCTRAFVKISMGMVMSCCPHPTDRTIKCWNLMNKKLEKEVDISSVAGKAHIQFFEVNGFLAAAALSDGRVVLVDFDGNRIVRKFDSVGGAACTCITFSPDGRWLAVANTTGHLSVFDMMASRTIDLIAFHAPILSMKFSPNGAFLLTSHANAAQVGAVHVWANRYLFDPTASAPLLHSSPTCPVYIDRPPAVNKESDFEEPEEDVLPEVEQSAVRSSAEPLSASAMTLSSLPPTQWQSLLHLEEIKERNKPTEAPTKPEKAPFFLPVAYETPSEARFVPAVPETGKSHVLTRQRAGLHEIMSPLQTLLKTKDFDGILKLLLEQTASGVHLMLTDVGPLAGGQVSEIMSMLEFFAYHVEKQHHADVIQTYLALFLQQHGDVLQSEECDEEIRAKAREVKTMIQSKWDMIDMQCHKISCFLKVFTNVALEAL